MCELPQAKPKIAWILPSLNFKASPFPPLLLVVMTVVTGGRAAWVVPLPKHSPSQGTTTHASFWGGVGRGAKDPVDKYSLPSPNCPPPRPGGSLLYPNPPCSPRQRFSRVWRPLHCGRPRGTSLVEKHKMRSQETQVLTPASILKPPGPSILCPHHFPWWLSR